jgi:hypothetical protein
MKSYILFSVSLLVVFTVYPAVADEAILIQQYDIAELMMNKYLVTVEQDEFTVFYRISTTGSFGEGTHEDFEAKITLIEVNQERQSLTIKLDSVAQTDIMSLRIPKELISAEGKQLALFIDGKETQYEWSVKEPYNNMIFIVPSHTAEIEIVGTRVIPEFTSGLLILIVSSAALVVPLARDYVYS